MSGDSTQGVALWAAADVASAVSASAATIAFIENLLILHSPNNLTGRPVFLNKSRTSFARQYDASRLATLSFHDAGFAAILRFSNEAGCGQRGYQDEASHQGRLLRRAGGFVSGAGSIGQ